MVLGLPSHEPVWKDTYFFASSETIFGPDTDLPAIFHKPGNFFYGLLLFLSAELKARNARSKDILPGILSILTRISCLGKKSH